MTVSLLALALLAQSSPQAAGEVHSAGSPGSARAGTADH